MKELIEDIYQTAVKRGFYNETTFSDHMIHIMSEVVEASKSDCLTKEQYENNAKHVELNINYNFATTYEICLKETFAAELSDIIISCLSLARHHNIDIEKHIELKCLYNKLREE